MSCGQMRTACAAKRTCLERRRRKPIARAGCCRPGGVQSLPAMGGSLSTSVVHEQAENTPKRAADPILVLAQASGRTLLGCVVVGPLGNRALVGCPAVTGGEAILGQRLAVAGQR